MIVKVMLFAVLKEALGESVEIDLPQPATVSTLLEQFAEQYPQFRSALPSLNVAVDYTYSRGDHVIDPGQEVAIFPPVSGG